MRIIHVVASIADEASGPSHSVPALADAQARAGHDVAIFSVLEATAEERCTRHSGVADRRFPAAWNLPVLARLRKSRQLARSLETAAADVIHSHGLWLLPNTDAAKAAERSGALFVVSPRGMLAPPALAFSRRKKQLFGLLLQNRALRQAGLFHATSESEAAEIRAYGLSAPIIIVPNGIDLPHKTYSESAPPFVLSLGRVHPKKGLDRLVRAFATLSGAFPDWRLVIAGPDEIGHTAELKQLAASLGLERVAFPGPVYGEEKWLLHGTAAIFALPTLNENFAMSVAEALAAATPVISSKGAPWSGLDENGCGHWVDHGVEPLAASLRALMALTPNERAARGARGRAWMSRDFSWDSLAVRLVEAYADALGRPL